MTDILQLFEALDAPTEAALRASIDRFGVLVPVHISAGPWQPGSIVDGHHRTRLAADLDVDCPTIQVPVADAEMAATLQRTLNTDRRHLPPEQRRQLVADLRADGHSLRAIGGALGVDHKTVSNDLKSIGDDSPMPATIRTSDGRRYPSTRPTPAPAPEPDGEPLFSPGEDQAIVDELVEANKTTEADATEAVAECVESKRVSANPIHKPDLGDGVSHPARFSTPLLALFRELLTEHSPGPVVLDPFAGTGRIHELRPEWETWGIEIEPEWAGLSEWTIEGSTLDIPWDDEPVDAIVTSPTYGNRLADSHNASDPDRRRSYTHDLGRPLRPDNSGGMQWGNEYRRFHVRAWAEVLDVLAPGGIFLLNIKDHIRGDKRQYVAGWHVSKLIRRGLTLLHHIEIDTGNLRQGANGDLRHPEQIYVFRKGTQ